MENKLYASMQSAYRNNHSTETALLRVVMALSIPSARNPPPPPPPAAGHLLGILQFCPPQGGAFTVTGQPGSGALSKAILSFRF